jgi:hypothetical protein
MQPFSFGYTIIGEIHMLTRRSFFGSAVAASSAVVAGRAAGEQKNVALVKESARDVPVAGSCDVLVAGGGPAGIAAAVTAARKGAKVVLLEMQGCLGGIWTSGMLSCFIGINKSDFDKEIQRRLEKYGAIQHRRPKSNGFSVIYEPEYMKLVCEEMCIEAGIRIRLHTSVTGVVKDASGRRIEAVITESKKGREAWLAKYFVDCTGDGDLGALSGCGFDVGGDNPGDPEQPASLIALLTIPDESGISRYLTNHPDNFDENGWLRIGFAGYQPEMAEGYVNTGSLYHCTTAFLALGLPSDDPFWTEPFTPWTGMRAWSGDKIIGDQAIKN